MTDARAFAARTLGGPRAPPGRPVLFSRPQPGVPNIGAEPRYRGHDESNNRSIVARYMVRYWADGSHKLQVPGDLIMCARTSAEADAHTTLVNWEKFNQILKIGYERAWREDWPRYDKGHPQEGQIKLPFPSAKTGFLHFSSFETYKGENSHRRESDQLKSILQNNGLMMDLDPQLREHLEEEYHEFLDDETQIIEARNLFSQKKDVKKNGYIYLTKAGIMTVWNFLGALQNTEDDVGEHYNPQRIFAQANVVIQKRARIYNRWNNELKQGQRLYMILKRRIKNDGSYAEFQLIPWTNINGDIKGEPHREDLVYYDLNGQMQFGKSFFVGTVYESLLETRLSIKREQSLGINGISLENAHEAKGGLDHIIITLTV